MTNREWLNSLSNEDFIDEYRVSCSNCPAREICDNNLLSCNAVLMSWLRKQHIEKEKMTNREWLESLTDKELADYLDLNCADMDCYGESCSECYIHWLRSKHKEENK